MRRRDLDRLCLCGSGKKQKSCHPFRNSKKVPISDVELDAIRRDIQTRENIRIAQQGNGRPLITETLGNYRLVAVGKQLHWSTDWKTVPDFLHSYLVNKFSPEWFRAETTKEINHQHDLTKWVSSIHQSQSRMERDANGLYSSDITGMHACYFGTAYSLYLLQHNVELQERLIKRLKDIRQFQGAYYELIVANCLIRSGFELKLEDETDQTVKHCEFSAHSKLTGKRFWIEAKMRSVSGYFGKTSVDSARGSDPTSQLSKHIRDSLKKPADGERMIFVDLNAKPEHDKYEQSWNSRVYSKLSARERELAPHEKAYIFVTNLPFHLSLEQAKTPRAVRAYGLGMPDFGKTGPLSDSGLMKIATKHIDAYRVRDAIMSYPHIPLEFDPIPKNKLRGE